MLTKRRPPLTAGISWAVASCLLLTGVFSSSCDGPTASDATAVSSRTPSNNATATGVILRADPNPVPPGDPKGKATITWDTGSDVVGNVYVVSGGIETLFASGRQGSQEAPWIQAGSTEFRLYNQTDHKLLAQLTVTMASANASTSSSPATPVSSANPR